MKDIELNIFCSNVRGLVKNWSIATSFNWDNYDLLGFNEIWAIQDYENLRVEGFEIKCQKLRTNRRGGGTVIFGRTSLTVKTLNTPFVEGIIETTGVIAGGFVFINIYRPPSGDKTDFVDILTRYLDTLRGKRIIIGGDFNLDTINGNNFLSNICNLYGLEIKINSITRIASGTCIDNFLSNIEGVYSVSELCIADHQAITCKLNVAASKINKEVHFYRDMKESNWQCFKGG